jgi:hypothetical protein
MKSKLSLSCVDIIQLVEQSGATNVAKASCPFTVARSVYVPGVNGRVYTIKVLAGSGASGRNLMSAW